MLKKMLIGVAAFGLTAAALANGNSVVTAAPIASDFNPGMYLGLQAGLGQAGYYRFKGYDDSNNAITVDDDNSLTGRIFAGYDFTKYWAAEFGYTYFGSKAKVTDNGSGNQKISTSIRTQMVDLVAKGKLPVLDQFDIYGKAGVVYSFSSFSGTDLSDGTKDASNDRNFGAALGIGADYYFMPNLWMDVSWTTHMYGKKFNSSSYQPDSNFYALGLAYKFNF